MYTSPMSGPSGIRQPGSPLQGLRSPLPPFSWKSAHLAPSHVLTTLTNPRYLSVPGTVPGGLWAHPLHSEKKFKGSLSASWLLL